MASVPNIQKQREQPETARAGFPWSDDENRNLREKINTTPFPLLNQEWYEKVAQEHRRTPHAIYSHILYLAVDMLVPDASNLREIAACMRIPTEELQKAYYKKHTPKKTRTTLRNKMLAHCTHLEKNLDSMKQEIADLRAVIEKLDC